MTPTADASDNPIDVVISWVDGDDPAHQARRARFQPQQPVHADANSTTRFASCGEVYLNVASILKYLPFVRTIWIVTDRQTPDQIDAFAKAGLCAPDKIKIVDHADILGDVPGVLPTFNSLTIETALWRIPGLANQYIYLNDDFMCLQTMQPQDFFADGRPVIRGTRTAMRHRRILHQARRFVQRLTSKPANTRPSFRLAQELGARHAGQTRDFVYVEHWPHPQLQGAQETFYRRNWDLFCKQVSYRLRSAEQFSPIALANHLVGSSPLLPPPAVAYLRPWGDKREDAAIDQFLGNDCLFGCMQSLDEIAPDKRQRLFRGLKDKLGDFLPIDLS